MVYCHGRLVRVAFVTLGNGENVHMCWGCGKVLRWYVSEFAC